MLASCDHIIIIIIIINISFGVKGDVSNGSESTSCKKGKQY
jgi:hypothetical protein